MMLHQSLALPDSKSLYLAGRGETLLATSCAYVMIFADYHLGQNMYPGHLALPVKEELIIFTSIK